MLCDPLPHIRNEVPHRVDRICACRFVHEYDTHTLDNQFHLNVQVETELNWMKSNTSSLHSLFLSVSLKVTRKVLLSKTSLVVETERFKYRR